MKINRFAIGTFAILTTVNSLSAQQPANKQAQQAPSSRQQSLNTAQTKDQTFAKWLQIANQEQIELSRFAMENSNDEAVKKFAATLVEAHQNCVEQLSGIAPQNESDPAVAATASTNSDKSTASIDFLQLQQEISTQCLKDAEEYLGTKEGVEFDECFVGMQIAKHAGMQSTLTVLQRHATGKLQGLIKDGLKDNSLHMGAAVKLMTRLAADDSAKLTKATK